MIVDLLRSQRVLPVLRLPSAAAASTAAEQMFASGLGVVELTATTESWETAVRDALRGAPPDAQLGLGTVLDARTAKRAIDAGVAFLVTPWPVPEVRAAADDAAVPLIEGAFTPAEIADGVRRGPTKVFPAHVGGPSYISSLLAVLPGADLIPTGGVTLADVGLWLRAGAAAVGVGSDLLRPGAVQQLRDLLAAADEGGTP